MHNFVKFQQLKLNINTDINILGSIRDYNIVSDLLRDSNGQHTKDSFYKTSKSFKRIRDAVLSTVIRFESDELGELAKNISNMEGFSDDLRMLLFWNSCVNNDLINYLNNNVYFPSFYSGRAVISKDEVSACLNELKNSEFELQKLSQSTIEIISVKYLSLLSKFGLVKKGIKKIINHPYLNDKTFLYFIYWLKSIDDSSNILKSNWLLYSFMEKDQFIEKVLKKRYRDYFTVQFTGDKLAIELLMNYQEIYNAKFES